MKPVQTFLLTAQLLQVVTMLGTSLKGRQKEGLFSKEIVWEKTSDPNHIYKFILQVSELKIHRHVGSGLWKPDQGRREADSS